jgi:hypothetical protein
METSKNLEVRISTETSETLEVGISSFGGIIFKNSKFKFLEGIILNFGRIIF